MKPPAVFALAVATALVTGGCLSRGDLAAETRCPWPGQAVDAAPHSVPTHLFAGIDESWTLARVFARLGPAQREIGTSAFTYEWVAADGRRFVAAASSRCGLVRRAGFVDAAPGGG